MWFSPPGRPFTNMLVQFGGPLKRPAICDKSSRIERTTEIEGRNASIAGPFSLLGQVRERTRRGVVVDAVRVVFLPGPRIRLRRLLATRPFVAAVVYFEVVEVPESDARNLVVGQGHLHVGHDQLGLEL